MLLSSFGPVKIRVFGDQFFWKWRSQALTWVSSLARVCDLR
jgi:hypothetical protein